MMKEKLQEKPKNPQIIASIITFVCMFISFFRPLYGDVDNYYIALVANKMFAGEGQDGYVLFLHPFLCKIFEGVHSISQSMDCVLIVALLMLLLSIWTISYVISRYVKNYYELIIYHVALFAVVQVCDLFHDNFTRWASFITAAGVIVLLTEIYQKRCDIKWQIWASLLMSCGMMWRSEAFIVFLPYIALEIGISFLFGIEKEKRRAFARVITQNMMLPMACVLVLGISSVVVMNSSKYGDAVDYSQARATVVDYAMKKWDEVTDLPDHITQNDYESVQKWQLMDTERINEQYYLELSEAGSKEAHELSIQGLISMQKQVLSVFIDTPHFHFLGPVMILLFFIGMCMKMPWYRKIQILLLYAGTDLIFLFFAYVGRAIERGYIPAIYALLISICALFLSEKDMHAGKIERVLIVGLLAFSVFFLGKEVIEEEWTTKQSVFKAAIDAENRYEALGEDEALYIWRVGAYVKGPMQSFVEQGKLMPESFMRHHVVNGAWIYGQLFFEQYLEKNHIQNPMRALLERKNTYYVSENYDTVLIYLQEHYNENTQVRQIGQVEGVPIWQFEILE